MVAGSGNARPSVNSALTVGKFPITVQEKCPTRISIKGGTQPANSQLPQSSPTTRKCFIQSPSSPQQLQTIYILHSHLPTDWLATRWAPAAATQLFVFFAFFFPLTSKAEAVDSWLAVKVCEECVEKKWKCCKRVQVRKRVLNNDCYTVVRVIFFVCLLFFLLQHKVHHHRQANHVELVNWRRGEREWVKVKVIESVIKEH